MSRNLCKPPYPIVIVITNLEYGGAQRQVVELVNRLDPARFDVHICSLSDYVPLADRMDDRKVRLHIIVKKWKYDVTVVPRLMRLLHRLKADIVHGYLFDAEIASRLAGRLSRTPLVFGSERNTNYSINYRQWIAYRLTRSCMDLLVANSYAGMQFDCQTFGYRPTQCRVVHNGVDTNQFRPHDGQALRHELGIGDSEYVVGMFASFKKQKNHTMFFNAARQVLRRLPQTRLLLVGDELYGGKYGSDAYKREIDRLVDALDIRKRCLFLGNRRDVDQLYCVCDLTVLSSFFEGTPNVALESMACGVPVIATQVSDNALVIPDGQVGHVIPLGDEAALCARICQLLDNGARRRQMGQAARTWVESEFSMDRLVEKTARVYQDAIDHLGKAPLKGNRP
jgi:glycosyltransferase involved in cell wall biosynthesis